MIERDIKQVVLSEDTSMETVTKALAKVETLQRRAPTALLIKSVIARLLHPLRIHYWVSWLTYDPASDRLIEMGLTCRFCPKGKTL